MRRFLISAVLALALPTVGVSAEAIPTAGIAAPPTVNAKSWLLIDQDSGKVIAEHNSNAQRPPASLTKLMTSYLIFERLKNKLMSLDDEVTVTVSAARQKGARLFLQPEEVLPLRLLLQGMIVRSANDATVALAEQAAGNEEIFVDWMNAKAQEWGLRHTQFANSTGVDHPKHYSSARDLAEIARALIRDFPEYYSWFAQREIEYKGIKQFNRNALLWRGQRFDGIKTGRTRTAGYCLMASAKQGKMRLLATILGGDDERARVEGGQALLDFGFRHYETRLIYAAKESTIKVRVWYGNESVLPLGLMDDLYLTLPRDAYPQLQVRLTVKEHQYAPIAYGQEVGVLFLDIDKQPYMEIPLLALKEIKNGNFFERSYDKIQLWFQKPR